MKDVLSRLTRGKRNKDTKPWDLLFQKKNIQKHKAVMLKSVHKKKSTFPTYLGDLTIEEKKLPCCEDRFLFV